MISVHVQNFVVIKWEQAEILKFWVRMSGKTSFDGFVQDCNKSIANAQELLLSCTQLSICEKGCSSC